MARWSRKDWGRGGVQSAEESMSWILEDALQKWGPGRGSMTLFPASAKDCVCIADVCECGGRRSTLVGVCECGGQRSTLAVVPQIPSELTK